MINYNKNRELSKVRSMYLVRTYISHLASESAK